jgi:hypothetical protein
VQEKLSPADAFVSLGSIYPLIPSTMVVKWSLWMVLNLFRRHPACQAIP